MASLLIPAGIVAVALFAGKNLKEQLQRISVTNFRLKVGSIKINEVLLQVTLDIYNPNTSQLVFGYFQGYIYRNGIRLGRFDFNATGTPMKFPGRSTTPATFNVRLTTVGIVANLFNILRNLHQQPANALNFSVDGILNVGGFDMPIKYEYNLKSGIAGIGGFTYPKKKMSKKQKAEFLQRQIYNVERAIESYNSNDGWVKSYDDFFAPKQTAIPFLNAKLSMLKNELSAIGKPYAKMEFGSNEELQQYFRKPCSEPKFSLNGSH